VLGHRFGILSWQSAGVYDVPIVVNDEFETILVNFDHGSEMEIIQQCISQVRMLHDGV
jgi:hypothetical protein